MAIVHMHSQLMYEIRHSWTYLICDTHIDYAYGHYLIRNDKFIIYKNVNIVGILTMLKLCFSTQIQGTYVICVLTT